MNALTLHNVESLRIEVGSETAKQKSDALALAKPITAVTTPRDQQSAVNAMRALQQLSKLVEKSRSEVKAPVLTIGRQIDETAREFVAEIEAEAKRLNKLVTDYVVEQQRIAADAERARLAEIQRIEDEKRKAAEAEAKRIAELERIKEEERRALEASFLADTDEEQAAAQAETERVRKAEEDERQRIDAERKRQQELEAESQRQQRKVVAAPVKAAGQVVRRVPKFEVTDIASLYAARPHLCRIEANASAINAVLSSGVREIPGLRIWEETQTQVR